MSKFMLSVALVLASLIGLGGGVQAGEPPAAAHQAELGVQAATLVYGPYLYNDALVVQNSLALQGYATELVLGNDGFYYVYAW